MENRIDVLPATIKLLLIEDDADFCDILRFSLRSEQDPPFQIENAPTLAEALKFLQQKHFDLILLDLGLPDSRGVETFDRLFSEHKEIPYVILSGTDDEHLALEVVRKGAQDYVVKGKADKHTLVRILRYALERHHQKKEVEELNERLEKLSILDPLTQLLNRRGLQRMLVRELQISGREGTNLVVILLDLDDFKEINDTFGHAAGDIVLQEVSKVLKKTVRAMDHVSRVGGDEFIILLPNTRPAEAVHFSERLRFAINRTPIVSSGGQAIQTTASFGVVNVTRRMLSIEELLEATHEALARSKQLGKNRVSFGDALASAGKDVSEMLRSGSHFRSVKQPILDLLTKKPVGYEFLSRSDIPGLEMPDEFLGYSAENNILSAVDHRCLEMSMTASFGVSPKYEKHINLFPSTISGLQKEELNRLFPPENLVGHYCVEISEQQILGDPSYLVAMVSEFKKRGIRIAIDDVGFGRSCLESLILLQPDVIKIDKKIVKDISRDKGQQEVLRRLLHVVESLDARIIAEGIETREDLETLKALGVRYGQGFLLGEPA
ncbi:MAG TPA: diguanylate cyclase [Candidatus Omnitrophota bacterium]|nr:diguanylate cyclase [Candidatus Omnitrophota bacterium]HPS37641.1 diguanylate cyclase [Candidatus Omnitrophota bacterium]